MKEQFWLTKLIDKEIANPSDAELKNNYSSRPVGGAEMGSWGGEDLQQGGGWRTREGEALASGPGLAVAGGAGGPTFVWG